MATSQPYTVAVNGGLVKSSNVIDLLKTPGVAKDLRNFEVSTEGGYRRINGYQKFGEGSSTQPTGGTTNILEFFHTQMVLLYVQVQTFILHKMELHTYK